MIHLLYGQDQFGLQEFLSSIKKDMGPVELRDLNVNVLDGTQAGFDELAATCDTVPFLADRRLVIVEGLLGSFERRSSSQPRSGSGAGGQSPSSALGQWEGLEDYLRRVPETTDLVFVDGPLSGANPLLAAVRGRAKVRTFPQPRAGEIRPWISQRAAAEGIDIEPGAVDSLADAVGANLGVIASELRKLSLYRAGEPIRREDVRELVADAREESIFRAVDAIVEGRPGVALETVHRLLRAGSAIPYILAMLARQVRLLMLAKELKAQRVPGAEHGSRLGLSGFPLRKTQEQERRFSAQRLAQIHGKLLEADLSIKTTGVAEELILDLLVAEIASVPPDGAAGARRSPRR